MDKMSMKREADLLEGIRLAELQLEKTKNFECSWDNENDVALLKSDKRTKMRVELLDKLVPKRLCMLCDQRFLNLQSWIVVKETAVCRSCFFRRLARNASEVLAKNIIGVELFGESATVIRYPLNRRVLIERRKAIGVSAAEFARLAGWSRSYQRKLESITASVGIDTKEVIETVFLENEEKGKNNV